MTALGEFVPEGDRLDTWLARIATIELVEARNNHIATRTAFVQYFRRGLASGLSLKQLMDLLPSVFAAVEYPLDEGRRVLEMVKALSLADIGARSDEEAVE